MKVVTFDEIDTKLGVLDWFNFQLDYRLVVNEKTNKYNIIDEPKYTMWKQIEFIFKEDLTLEDMVHMWSAKALSVFDQMYFDDKALRKNYTNRCKELQYYGGKEIDNERIF